MNMRPNGPPNMLAPPPAPPTARHVCFSSAIACSGVEPCDTCSQVLKEHVFKVALAHAVTVEQQAIHDELNLSAQQRRPVNIDFQRLANLVFANFFAALAQGFQQLHQQIDTEMLQPPENRSFTARDMAAIMQSAIAYQALLRERASMAAAATNGAAPGRNGQGPPSAQPVLTAPFAPPFAPPSQGAPAHVVFEQPPPAPPAPPAPVNFDQAMQVADANMPPPPQPAQASSPDAPLNGAGETTKPSRRLTPDDFEMASETRDETHDASRHSSGTSSS